MSIRNLLTFTNKGFQVITNIKNINKRMTKRDLILFCGKISDIKMGHQEKEKEDTNKSKALLKTARGNVSDYKTNV